MIRKSLLISSFVALPLVNNGSALATNVTINNKVSTPIVNDILDEDDKYSCSFMYVGKDASTTGKAYVARSGDSSPTTMLLYSRVFKHNELANTTVYGKNGFSWKMPSTTYKYASTPRNRAMGKGINWEVSGINEKGVGVSATLSCEGYAKALEADPLEKTKGITEDNITQIVAAVADSAKAGIQYIANIIDQVGSGENNAIMVTDKNETWYMEMYTGHQYAAVKLPDDVACTMGNEYSLDTLADFKDEDIIVSPGLLELPVKNNFAVFEQGKPQTLKHLNLYKTYAAYNYEDEYKIKHSIQGGFNDACHMRTWIGHNRFAYNNEPQFHTYDNSVESGKLSAFFKPDNKLSPNDVISYMRDRFETITDNPADPNYDYFKSLADQNKLRYVGYESAYQIHIISVDPTLPEQMSIQELLCLSNSAYSPFIPVNNAINSFIDPYQKVVSDYCYDHETASSIYKRLNALAATNRALYGKPVESFIHEHELAWQEQYDDIIAQAKNLSLDKAQEALTNFCKSLQIEGLLLSDTVYDDLLFHIENTTKGATPKLTKFEPLVHLEYYANLYGWKYERKDKIVKLTSGVEELTFDLNYVGLDATCKMWTKTGSEEKLIIHIKDDQPYVQHSVVTKYIASPSHKLAKLDINDYLSKGSTTNPLTWIIPISVGIPVITAAIAIPLAVVKKRKINQRNGKYNKKK